MKSLKVKSYNKLIVEDIKIGDPKSREKLRKRIVDLSRLAKECRSAAKEADAADKTDLSRKLNQRAEELEQAVANWNTATIDVDDAEDQATNSNKSAGGQEDKNQKGKNQDDNDAEESNQEAEDGKDSDSGKDSENGDFEDKNEPEGKFNDYSSAPEDSSSSSGQKDSGTQQDGKGKDSGEENDDQDKGEDAESSNSKNSEEDEEGEGSGEEGEPNESESEEGNEGEGGEDSQNSQDDKQQGKQGKQGQQGDQGNNDDENENDSDDDTPVEDPFANDEDIPSLTGPNGKEPREATIDDIIKQLGELTGDAKRGALDGLRDLLNQNKQQESLTEALKGIREMSDDEFADVVNDTIDLISEIKKPTIIDDLAGVKADVKKWSESPTARQELADEEKENKVKDILHARARKKEAEKYSSYATLDDFEIDFEQCIADQVDVVWQDYQDYSEINPEYEGEDIIYKADIRKQLPDDVIPSIDVYFDRSGSWYPADTAIGKRAIATVQKKFVDEGKCTMDLYYFDDYVTNNASEWWLGRGSTDAWPRILENIKATGAKNVVIMTDHDMNNDAAGGPTVIVEGCVWWLWRNGITAPECVKHLRGMQHNFQANFNRK